VLPIAGDQKIRTRRIGTFNEDVVVWIARHLDPVRWSNQVALVTDLCPNVLNQENDAKEDEPYPSGRLGPITYRQDYGPLRLMRLLSELQLPHI
jgi:hypothetical protein